MGENLLVGVDLGGTTIKLAFITFAGEIKYKWEIPTNRSEHGKYIIEEIARSLQNKLTEIGLSKERLAGIGVGAPGPVHVDTGVVYGTINIGWGNYPLMDLLESATGLPVSVDNDANVAAIGEMWKGAGVGAQNLVCVTLGTGVGGGIITNGEIVHGAGGAAGEIGHITVIAENGAPCNCGKTGCLETVASATGIVNLMKETLQQSKEKSILHDKLKKNESITAKDVFDAAHTDAVARSVVDKMAFYLGLVIANIANTLNPEKVIIGGGVSRAGNLLLSSVQQNFVKYAFPRVKKSTKLALAMLGNDAGVIGCAWLVKKKVEMMNEKKE